MAERKKKKKQFKKRERRKKQKKEKLLVVKKKQRKKELARKQLLSAQMKKHSKFEKARQMNWEVGEIIRSAAVFNIKKSKKPKTVAKYFAQVLIIFVIAVGIFIYLDPAINIIAFPLSFFLALFLVIILMYLQFIFKK